MNKLIRLPAAAAALCVATLALAAATGSKDEAQKMAVAAAEHVKKVGAEQAFKDFSTKGGKWHDRDLYVFCWDFRGNSTCHGANEKLIGKNFIDLKDSDGKAFVREFIAVGQSAGGRGWVDYKWTNPLSKKVEAKTSYMVRVAGSDVVLGVGAYAE
jgi:signal transduction histidine kinase